MANVKCLIIVMSCPAHDASDAKSGPFLQEIMSLKGLELPTKHAEPLESAPETIYQRHHLLLFKRRSLQRKNLLSQIGALSLCTKLSELHTKAPEHSFAYTKKTIEPVFGRKLPEIFDNFAEKPATSGSIAQVHGAGQQVKPIVVAVKGSCPFVHPAVLVGTYEQGECVDDLQNLRLLTLGKFDPEYNGMQTLLLKAD
ncbi:unnamed protein product [Prunus armeniaca]|uniref:ABC1 atypical kinase-like domain-containing protein n=1 Tax=Prunus armeniaca TaxID=36596 RepID=A0A6J5UDG0_PRUAR|nr:unnamed protein product [Prunus armeniaca]